MSTRYDVRLSFITNKVETLAFTVPRANSLLTQTQIRDAMTGIIDTGIVLSRAGEPTQRNSANLITTNIHEFNVL